jgi:hypothetical protein
MLPDDAEPNAQYTNSFEVGFNAYEFVLAFAIRNGPEPGRTHTRIITSPNFARGLSELLQRSLLEYDDKYEDGRRTAR